MCDKFIDYANKIRRNRLKKNPHLYFCFPFEKNNTITTFMLSFWFHFCYLEYLIPLDGAKMDTTQQ